MSVVLYINKLGDDPIAIIGTIRRYYGLSFFEVSDMLETAVPIELPPLDETYVDTFTREMSETQSEIGRTATVSMEHILEVVKEVFSKNEFGQAPGQSAKPQTDINDSAPFAQPKPITDINDSAPFAQPKPITDINDSAPFAQPKPITDINDSTSKFTVRIINCGNQKLSVVKYVKELLNCSLAEAKDQVDNNLICLEGTSQQAAKVVSELKQFGCLATVALAGEAPKPTKASTPTIGAANSAAPKSASGNVQLVLESVRGTAFKILGIITKAYGLSYGDAGKYLRTGATLPPLPAAEAAKVAEQLRALGCTIRS
ncbi:MAG: ribosomal protein L7/L12 [Muribaculaceae bacterium]